MNDDGAEFEFQEIFKKSRASKEYAYQVCAVDWLYGRTRKGNKTYGCNPPMPGLLFTHHFAGRKGSDAGFFLGNLGVRPGMGDLLNWWNIGGRLEAGFLELKVDADMSPAQHKIKGTCIQLGIRYDVAEKTKEDVFKAYHKWGWKPLHYAMATPDYRSPAEKKQQSFDMYKP